MPVRFRDIIKPEHYKCFRWKFFRVHFQFVMANERPHAYDFFMIVCGPIPLSERMAVPDAALAIATGDPAARECGLETRSKRLKPMPPDAAELGGIGTFCPPQRLKSRRFSALRRGNPAFSAGWLWPGFGVKLAVLWAVESGLPLISDGSKHFK